MSNWQKMGQALAAIFVVVVGLMIVGSLPNPAWKTENLADSTIQMAAGLETHWEDAYVGRLGASDIEKWNLEPNGWHRSGNGWRVGRANERFEVGTWKEESGQRGFALIYHNLPPNQCKDLTRLLGDAFDQVAINGQGQLCSLATNMVVFYRNPA